MKRKGTAVLTAVFMLISSSGAVLAENDMLDDGAGMEVVEEMEETLPEIDECSEEEAIQEEVLLEDGSGLFLPETQDTGESVAESEALTSEAAPEELSSGEPWKEEAKASVRQENMIELYALNPNYAEKIQIPSSYQKNYQITIPNGEDVIYRVVSGKSVKVSDKGLVQPSSTKWIVVSTGEIIEEYDFGISVVEAISDGKTYTYTFEVKDYADAYASTVIDEYIAKNITGSMTNMEKLRKIAYFPCQYDYSAKHSSAAGMIIFGGGDCWASTDAILTLCEKVGFPARIRDAYYDPGAGNGHINALVQIDGQNYIVDAGYDQKAPRRYDITKQVREYAYKVNDDGKTVTFQMYYGLEKKFSVPETLDGYPVTVIGDRCFAARGELRELTIPSSVQKIEDYAFYNTGIQTIKIPEKVTEIGEEAFGNTEIQKVKIPEGVTEIGNDAFTYVVAEGSSGGSGEVRKIEIIELPSTVKKLGLDLRETIVLYHGTQQQWNDISTLEGYAPPAKKNLFCSNNGLAVSETELSLKPGETKTLKIYSTDENISLTTGNKGVIEAAAENEIIPGHFYKDGKNTPARYAVKTLTVKGTGAGNTALTVSNGRSSKQIHVTVKGEISKSEISNCTVTLSQEKYTYNGQNRTPSVAVKEKNRILEKGKDYTLSYENNKTPGTAKVVITGMGNYTGSVTKYFTINKGNQKIELSDVTKRLDSKTYTLKAKITQGNKTGKFGYKSDNPSVATVTSWGKVTFTGVGTAKITATTRGSANYNSASKTITLTVLPAPTAITKLRNNGTGWLNIQWRANRNADGYQIQYGTSPDWKGAKTASVKDSGIRSYTRKDVQKGNTYYVRVRTYKMKDGAKYYSNWSGTKNAKISK